MLLTISFLPVYCTLQADFGRSMLKHLLNVKMGPLHKECRRVKTIQMRLNTDFSPADSFDQDHTLQVPVLLLSQAVALTHASRSACDRAAAAACKRELLPGTLLAHASWTRTGVTGRRECMWGSETGEGGRQRIDSTDKSATGIPYEQEKERQEEEERERERERRSRLALLTTVVIQPCDAPFAFCYLFHRQHAASFQTRHETCCCGRGIRHANNEFCRLLLHKQML